MSTPGPDTDRDRFDHALRAWATRPPVRDAGRAALRVLAALPGPPASFPWRRLAAAAAVVALVVLGAWFGTPDHGQVPAATAMATPPLPENVMVFWIDRETPVYFVLTPLGSVKGDAS